MISVAYKPGFLRSWKKLPPALQNEIWEKVEYLSKGEVVLLAIGDHEVYD